MSWPWSSASPSVGLGLSICDACTLSKRVRLKLSFIHIPSTPSMGPGGYSQLCRGMICFLPRVHHAGSGRVLEVYTTQPGIQFYTGNFLDGTLKGKSGAVYPKHSGFCLETQNWPDAVHQPNFPPVLLRPGEEYDHTTWLKFSVA